MFARVAAAESLLFLVVASGWMGTWAGLLTHGMLVVMAAGRLQRCRGGDKALWLIGVLATAMVGPLGAICGTALAIRERRTRPSHDLLAAWYKRICGEVAADHVDQVQEAILTGRAVRAGSAGSRRFADIIEHGTLSEKQALLGLIGLKYHNDYFPILGLALRNKDACVRAQAAAVFVKLKEEFKNRLNASVAIQSSDAGPKDREEALARADTILQCAGSGFIDAAAARDAHSVAKELCKSTISGGQASVSEEALHYRALAANDEHLELVHTLQSRAATLDSAAQTLLANSLISLRRHRELHDLLRLMNTEAMAGFGQGAAISATAL
jgi:hypothetical protein